MPAAAGAETRQISVLDAAKLALAAGDLQAAQDILAIALKKDPDSTDAQFLTGELAGRRGDYAQAAEHYRRILVDHPDIVRVRLELARALYEIKDDDAAEYHFRLALAQPGIPEAVIDNVYRYLGAIRKRKKFVFFFDAGIAPDTNVNAAPAKRDVTLFGLPFQLNQDAKQKSGVGVVVSGNGDYLAPIRDDLRFRTGGSFYRAEYAGGKFDDMQVRAHAGPQFLWERSDLSVLGVFAKRWYGNDPYSEGVGGRIEGSHALTDRLRLEGYVEGLSLTYHSQDFLNGYTVQGDLYTTYGLSSSSFIRLITGAGKERTVSAPFSDYQLRVGAGYLQNLPWGITTYVQPLAQWSEYEQAAAAFGGRREDTSVQVQFSVYKRDIQLFGFSPVFSYTFTHNASNVDIYSFTRHQFRIGLTREF
ncbi:MAG TPA: surface lipoprotein assembly modifier [Stellaceae bacterium]